MFYYRSRAILEAEGFDLSDAGAKGQRDGSEESDGSLRGVETIDLTEDDD